MFKKLIIIFTVLLISIPQVCALSSDDISAECAVVITKQSGDIVFAKNEYQKHSMASTTKIMTALIAAESGKLQNEMTVSESMLKVEGTSMGLLPGDSVSLDELLYGMLLQSGNDAANVTALYLGGSLENFAGIMNLRAKQIGMMNTHFVTPSGLDDDDHYSTAYDMALLGRAAIKNNKFLSVCSKKTAVLTYGNPPYKRTLTNHNRLLSYYPNALGIKTGFTKKSGRCLVSYAEKNGVGLIAVTLNDPNDWYDHKAMLNYCFDLLYSEKVITDCPAYVKVVGGTNNCVGIMAESFSAESTLQNKITQKTYIQKFLYAPIKTGQVVGHTDYYSNGVFIGSSSLTCVEDVEKNDDVIIEKDVEPEKGFFERLFEKIKERF